jgi:hypothetical protein
MARIQLRDTTLYLQDGLSGSATVDQPSTAPAATDTTLTIDAVSLNTSDDALVPIGARFTIDTGDGTVHTVTARTPTSASPTTDITFTPALATGNVPADDDGLTFLPQRLEIQVGEGEISWSETREFIYDRDRDVLDTVRQGQDQPMSVDIAFTFEYVTASTDATPTPVDALKQTGEASEWVSSSSDLCEPYAVDVIILHCVPCGTDEDQEILLPDFRYETLDYSVNDAAISVSGQCNATDATVTRSDNDSCS